MSRSQVVGLALVGMATIVSSIGLLVSDVFPLVVGLIAAVAGLILLTLRWEDALRKSPDAARTGTRQRLMEARD